MKVAFTVVNSTPSNEGKTFVWKLEALFDVVAFGIKKSVKRTFYIGNMPEAATVGVQVEEDMAKFEIVERPFTHPESNDVMMLKWLHVKPY